MITIIDYHLGNLGSIQNMLRKLGHESEVTSDAARVASATALILPGVGAFDRGMSKLRELGLLDALNERVIGARVPVLGICLGAQLMTERSEEGDEPGLGWLAADTVRFFSETAHDLPVPSMGWSELRLTNAHWIFEGNEGAPRFYFVHSFHFRCRNESDVIAWSHYGYEFPAAFAKDNVIGVQFHPEKSHKYGMRMLDRFARHVRDGAVTVEAGK